MNCIYNQVMYYILFLILIETIYCLYYANCMLFD